MSFCFLLNPHWGYVSLILEREEGKRAKHQSVAFMINSTEDWNWNLGMCPNWNQIRNFWYRRTALQWTEQPGQDCSSLYEPSQWLQIESIWKIFISELECNFETLFHKGKEYWLKLDMFSCDSQNCILNKNLVVQIYILLRNKTLNILQNLALLLLSILSTFPSAFPILLLKFESIFLTLSF